MNEYFKSIVDQERVSVVICNLQHEIIYMNPAAIKNYAKRGGEALIGKVCLPVTIRNRTSGFNRWLIGLQQMSTTILYIPVTMQSRTRMYTWWLCGTVSRN
jgi:PAS domain-containing protein